MGDLVRGKVRELIRLHLVTPTAVDSSFFDETVAGERLDVREHDWVEIGLRGQGGFQGTCEIEQQVDVRRCRPRRVPEKAERIAVALLSSHVRAEEGSGVSF